ncbi:hypothetical protein Hanom_Chr12g01141031 [Helianthus anomalus]
MMLYPRFLMIIFRHHIPNILIHKGLSPLVLTPIGRRIFGDCRNVKASVQSTRLPELRPMLGAILVEDYNLANDQTRGEVFAGLFGASDDEDGAAMMIPQQMVVDQPHVDPQQFLVVIEEPVVHEPTLAEPRIVQQVVVDPISEPVNEPSQDIEMEAVTPDVAFEQADPNPVGDSFDRELAKLDGALEAGVPTASSSKGKLSSEDQAKIKAFRNKVDALGPSSEWALNLSIWIEKTLDLNALPNESLDSDNDGDDDRRPVAVLIIQLMPIMTYMGIRLGEGSSSSRRPTEAEVVSTIEVLVAVITTVTDVIFVSSSSRQAQSSSSAVPVATSGVSTTPLFTTFPVLPSSCNLFATSVGVSSSSFPLFFITMPPGSTLSFVHLSDPRRSGPRLRIRPKSACNQFMDIH